MKKRIKKFIVIEFEGLPGGHYWPKTLPLPRIGERILVGRDEGVVKSINHNLSGNVYEYRVLVSRFNPEKNHCGNPSGKEKCGFTNKELFACLSRKCLYVKLG